MKCEKGENFRDLTPAVILPGHLQICSRRHQPAVAESLVHRRMKEIVRGELEREDYRVVEEPLSPPSEKVSWSAYRPDLLGYRLGWGEEELVVVECETHPSMRRFELKNHSSLWFQPFLFHRGSIRRILAVPQGKLGAVDVQLRREWEIWVLGSARPMCRIGLLDGQGPPESGIQARPR